MAEPREPAASGAGGTATRRTSRPDWGPRFLEVVAATGNVRLAASAAGVSRDAPYKRGRRDPRFAARWLRAREEAVDTLEAEARRRALDGSDALLMFLLRSLRPAVYRDRVEVALGVRREATRLAEAMGLAPEEVLAEAERIARDTGR